jgi:hypothetical protein
MTTNKQRVAQLEKTHAPKVNKYLCVIMDLWDTPEKKAKGYKVQPCTAQFGGTGGDPFYLATRADLDAFAARPDVDLGIVEIIRYTDKHKSST